MVGQPGLRGLGEAPPPGALFPANGDALLLLGPDGRSPGSAHRLEFVSQFGGASGPGAEQRGEKIGGVFLERLLIVGAGDIDGPDRARVARWPATPGRGAA